MNEHDKFLERPYVMADIDHTALQAEIASEAEALLAEWSVKPKALLAADEFDQLLEDRGEIIYIAAFALAQIGQEVFGSCRVTERDAAVLVGNAVIRMVRACAVQVATHTITEAV